MFVYLICFLPRTKASILLGLIRFRSLSCSSFVRKQNEVLYNTQDLVALLFSSLGFNCHFFQLLFNSSLNSSHCAVTDLQTAGLGCSLCKSKCRAGISRAQLCNEQLRSTTKSWRSGALLCRSRPADL